MLDQMLAVAWRVLRQLSHDRRFVGLSLIVPTLVIYMLYVFFEAVDRPFFDAQAFVPPVGAFIVHMLTYILCAIALVRERTQNTMTRMFVNGYQRISIIGGYILAYTALATLQSLLVLIELNILFKLNYSASTFISMYLVIWLLAIISIALGILVSNFARNEGQVLPMFPLVLMPSVFFSGMIVSIDTMPEWAQVLGLATPMYYATESIKSISDVFPWSTVFTLLFYGAVVMTLAVFTLREQE